MKIFLFICLFFTIISNGFAQLEEVFIARDDAAIYVEHYLNPAFKGLMYSLNSGWYSQSKTHKKFGFDFSFSASLAMVPEEDKSFTFLTGEYNNLNIDSGSSQLPTVAGEDSGSTLVYQVDEAEIVMNALDGYGKEWMQELFIPISIPAPMIQASLGLPLKTDIIVRFFPKTSREEVSFDMFGGGIKHSLSQYFTKDDDLFSVSALVALNRINVIYTPKNIDIQGSNQTVEMHLNTYTMEAVAGVDLKIVNLYMALGYVSGSTDLGVKGTYEYDADDDGSISNYERVIDPLSLNFSMSGFKSTLGFRLNLGPVKIFTDYSYQEYSTLTAGLAVSIR